MANWQYWAANSGDTFAVLVGEDGTVLRMTAALDYREVTQANLDEGGWATDAWDQLTDEEREQDAKRDYRLVEPPYGGDETEKSG